MSRQKLHPRRVSKVAVQHAPLAEPPPEDRVTAKGKLWPYVLSVLLLPVLVLWHKGDALYSPIGMSDAWIYLGYFRQLLEFKRNLFYGFYYGSRLAWILPGFLFHSLFSPATADNLLHLAVHSTATLSFFTILRLFYGVRRAFLMTLVFAVQPWLWVVTGTNYVFGPAVAYYLLASALLTYSAAAPRRQWALLLSGAAFAGMVYTQIFCASFLPCFLLHHFVLRWAWRRESLVQSTTALAIWAGSGFAAVTIVFAGINYWIDGNVWFYASSVAQARYMANGWAESLRLPIWQGGRLVPWLWPIVAACAVGIVLMPLQIRQGVRRNALPLLLSLELLLATGYMAWVHSRGNSVLGHYSYACFLMPFVFLVFGSSFWPMAESMSQRVYVALCGVSLAVLAVSWYKPEGHAFLVAPWVQLLAAIIAVCLLILALLLRRHVLGSVPAMTGFVIFSVLGLNQSAAIGAHTNRPTFDRLVGMWDRINAVRDGREIRFWYNADDSDWLTNFAFSALFLNFVTLSEHFPAGCEIPVDPNTLVIVSSRNQGITGKARSALTDCWRNAGMHPVLELTETLAGPYTLAVFRAERDSAKWLSLQVTFDRTGAGELVPLASGAPPSPFPADRWVVDAYPVDRAVLTPVAAGLHVRAPKSPFGFAVGYVPLRAPITGWYYFVLKLRDTSGWFAFGARPGDDSTYLVVDRLGHTAGDHREMSLWVNLKKGDMVRLRTANNDLIGFGPARFVMEQLSASVVPAP